MPLNLTFVDGSNTSYATVGIVSTQLPNRVGDSGWYPIFGSGAEGRAILPLGDACSPLDASTPDLSGLLPLVTRSGCDLNTKLRSLAKFNPDLVLVYNDNSAPAFTLTDDITDEVWVTVGMLSKEAGEAVVAAVKAGQNVTASFPDNGDDYWQEGYVGFDHTGGGIPNVFTSIGPENRLEVKPDVAAPGGDIYSTSVFGAILGAEGLVMKPAYEVLNGTSMATPYISGIAALYVGQFGGRAVHGPGFAKMLVRRIISSGSPMKWNPEVRNHFDGAVSKPVYPGATAPVMQVGSGLVDAWKVLKSTTQLGFEKFALNDTKNFVPDHEVTITNLGPVPVTYTFGIKPLSGVEAKSPKDTVTEYLLAIYEELTPVEITPEVALPQDVTLAPGEAKTVKCVMASFYLGNITTAANPY